MQHKVHTDKHSHKYACIFEYTIFGTQEANTHSIWGYLGQVSMDREQGRGKKRERHMWKRDKDGTDRSTDRGKGEKKQTEKE